MKIEIAMKIFGKDVLIPDSIVNSFLVVIILTIFAIVVNRKIKKASVDEKPSGFLNFIEVVIQAINGLVKDTMGPQNMFFAPYITTLALFLLVANLFGLLGFTPPTSDYSVTFSLALITFALTQIFRFKSLGFLGYFKSFADPALLTPLNVIGELANPVSLSFRLFGNILSGVIIMGLLYSALGYFAPIVTPVLHGYFDVFSGVLQTFIFTMLTMIFISSAME